MKQPREQIASHSYKRPMPASVNTRRMPEGRVERELPVARAEMPSLARASRPHQRVVTMPEAVQPTAWNRFAERRDQLHSRAKPHTYTKLKPRALAQTGMPASSGQMRPVKRSLPRQNRLAVPLRSGRRNAGRSGFLWKLLGFFAILALVILGANLAFTSPAFRVEQVSIVGTHSYTLVHSIQHMGIQGQNIFLIDVAALTARIDMSPMVASATLEKQWPNQLQIRVVERVPVLLWQTQHGTFSVDNQGVVIAPASETTGADRLMTVVDMSTCKGAPGGCPASGRKGAGGQFIRPGGQLNQADIAFARAVFEQLPKLIGITDFTLRYDETLPAAQNNLGGNGVFMVESRNGWVAYLGGANDTNPLSNRLIELQQILVMAQQQQLNLATVDLRFGLRPVYTLKN